MFEALYLFKQQNNELRRLKHAQMDGIDEKKHHNIIKTELIEVSDRVVVIEKILKQQYKTMSNVNNKLDELLTA